MRERLEEPARLSFGRFIRISILAWLAFLAVDFLVHAGLLEAWYARGAPALLPVEQAFARIPFGYLAFLILVMLIVWLGSRLGIRGAREGFALGLMVGLPLAVSHGLGLYSITTIDPLLLVWWSLAEGAELAVAGAVTGSALASPGLGRVTLVVVGSVVASLLLTIALQNL